MNCKTEKSKKEFVYTYKLMKQVLENEITFKVVGPDGFEWAKGSTAKGALLGALACGVQLNTIEINHYVKDFNKVLARAYGGA